MALRSFDEDTIVAVSTPPGEGGIGVVRLSGSEAIAIVDKIFEAAGGKNVAGQPHMTAQYGFIIAKEGTLKKKIDEVLVLVMRSPKSYTREDVVEISAHGGSAVLRAIVELTVSAGARPAEKGEFTKRAFLSGRLDLLQAEAVLDLISAKTDLGREWAVARLEGMSSKKMKALKDELLGVLSHLEAAIDFPDDFLTTDSYLDLEKKCKDLSKVVENLLESAHTGLILKNGLKAVIAGRPNVGKSSLLNALCRMNRAIVTPFPGTTRDVVGEEIQIGGFPVWLYDTAGIHETEHPIEKEGIVRSKNEVADADLILYVLDASLPVHVEDEVLVRGLSGRPVVLILNKMDLASKTSKADVNSWVGKEGSLAECSSVLEGGAKDVEEAIKKFMTKGSLKTSEGNTIGSARQKELLEKTLIPIERARRSCHEKVSPELVAVDIRAALGELGLLVGEVYTDDVLEVLFKQFCIGK